MIKVQAQTIEFFFAGEICFTILQDETSHTYEDINCFSRVGDKVALSNIIFGPEI